MTANKFIKLIKVRGIELAYEVFGSGPQDIIFIHGATYRYALYKGLLDELALRFRIIALDCRGHGGSAKVVDKVTVDQLSDDILAVTSALNLRQAIYVGHSMGGLLGLVCAIKEPQRFKALVVITPGPVSYGKSVDAEFIERRVRAHQNKEFTIADEQRLYVRAMSEKFLKAGIEAAYLMDPIVYKNWAMVERKKENRIFDRLEEIEIPTLFINGIHDIAVSIEEQHRMALTLPHCKEVVFTDEGHMLPLEAPRRTALEIINFYTNI